LPSVIAFCPNAVAAAKRKQKMNNFRIV
jgi:hypothetical protein